ncbi:MAG: fibronectin type III domain-containing protein [Candidatus Daviesbacteria bacterium]|nr:MAG: fibronectin type III domain-containing protein [Candidatus Daviesbacteria bacterium]
MNILTKLRIPTLLGLAIILGGLGTGVYLVLQNQYLAVRATPETQPKNITVSNIEDTSAVISWQTDTAVPGFVTIGQKSDNEQTILDDRDQNVPQLYFMHLVTVRNLSPATAYQYRIVSGKNKAEVAQFQTAAASLTENGFKPIVGSVLESGRPLKEGMAYLAISGALVQAGLIKDFGNFIIPIAKMRETNLQGVFQPSKQTTAKLSIVSGAGSATMVFNLTDDGKPLPSIKIGEQLDLTASIANASSSKSSDLDKFDLNNDRFINASDYGIVVKNLGKNPKEKRADLNSDGVVDKKDLDLMSQKISEQK